MQQEDGKVNCKRKIKDEDEEIVIVRLTYEQFFKKN